MHGEQHLDEVAPLTRHNQVHCTTLQVKCGSLLLPRTFEVNCSAACAEQREIVCLRSNSSRSLQKGKSRSFTDLLFFRMIFFILNVQRQDCTHVLLVSDICNTTPFCVLIPATKWTCRRHIEQAQMDNTLADDSTRCFVYFLLPRVHCLQHHL